ncbi:sensor domain-containing diguanylate cyclase [bacterium]|nr:sensor domain-containing diguanylate cyclase [bacterium]
MNRKKKHYGILIAAYILIVCLILLGQQSEVTGFFLLLLLPLILLASMLEDVIGAFIFTLLAALTVVGCYLNAWLPQSIAIVQVVTFGGLFGFLALQYKDRELLQKEYLDIREPKEKELLKIERKAFMIRRQIEGYEKRLKGLIKLYEVAKKLSGILKLETMLDEARVEVSQILPHHFQAQSEEDVRLAFYIPEEDTSDFQKVLTQEHEISDAGFPAKLKAVNLRSWLGDNYSPLRLKDLTADPRFYGLRQETPFRALIIMPLVVHEIVIGVMLLGSSQPIAFSPQDFKQAEVLGKQIVFALRKALLYRKVQTLSFTDSQTGLYVHRYFQERLREEIHRAERYHQPLSLIMLDIDHFKKVNDKNGHQVGDAVLVEAAARIQEMSGPTALVARYGGEEFAVLLPNTIKVRAAEVAKSINRFLKATLIDIGGLKLTLTISAGVSTYPTDAFSQESLIVSADEALYQAKHAGRDRVSIYEAGNPKKD